MNIIILAAGDFPTHEVPLRALGNADLVVCCDSAYRVWEVESGKRKMNKPFVVIGDGDSLSEVDKKALGDRWIEVDEQDYNDLHKAMQYVMDREWGAESGERRITILGATGKREDHTLGNISYLVTFAEEFPGADIEILTDYGRFVAMRGSRTFMSFPRQQVSIFSMDSNQPIYSEGLRWHLNGLQAQRWWQATLNEALASEFSLRSEGWLVVFQTYEEKEVR